MGRKPQPAGERQFRLWCPRDAGGRRGGRFSGSRAAADRRAHGPRAVEVRSAQVTAST